VPAPISDFTSITLIPFITYFNIETISKPPVQKISPFPSAKLNYLMFLFNVRKVITFVHV
jgi:hypothetical protein